MNSIALTSCALVCAVTHEACTDAQIEISSWVNAADFLCTSGKTVVCMWHATVQAYENGTEEDEKFVQNLALFLTTFLKEHLPLIEGNAELKPALVSSFSYLVRISYVQDPGAHCVAEWSLLSLLLTALFPNMYSAAHCYMYRSELPLMFAI